MINALRITLSVAVLAAIAACNDSTSPISVTGTWSFSDAINNSQLAASCSSSGAIDFNQNGDAFTGNVGSGSSTCIVGSQSSTSSLAGGFISNGQINGSSVSFVDDGGCTYTGTLSGDPANHMSGDETCIVPINGTNYTFTGSWQATR